MMEHTGNTRKVDIKGMKIGEVRNIAGIGKPSHGDRSGLTIETVEIALDIRTISG